jgi:hypothetical protein
LINLIVRQNFSTKSFRQNRSNPPTKSKLFD